MTERPIHEIPMDPEDSDLSFLRRAASPNGGRVVARRLGCPRRRRGSRPLGHPERGAERRRRRRLGDRPPLNVTQTGMPGVPPTPAMPPPSSAAPQRSAARGAPLHAPPPVALRVAVDSAAGRVPAAAPPPVGGSPLSAPPPVGAPARGMPAPVGGPPPVAASARRAPSGAPPRG